MIKNISVLVGIVFFSLSIFATSSPQINVTVDRELVQVGDIFEVEVEVVTEGLKPEIIFPQTDAFKLVEDSDSTRFFTQFSIGTGFGGMMKIHSSVIKTFRLIALKPGRFRIGPFKIRVGSQLYEGGIVEITVLDQAGKQNYSQNQSSSPIQHGPQPVIPPNYYQSTPSPQIDVAIPEPYSQGNMLDFYQYDPNIFLRVVVTPAEGYMGQQFVYTLYLYCNSKIACREEDVVDEPQTDDFWVENLLGPLRSTGFQYQQFVRGELFNVSVLRRLALFPLKAGKLKVGPARVEVLSLTLSLWGGRSRVKLESSSIEIEVSSLPEAGKPSNFNPNNVGDFQLSANIDRTQVELGEPITFTVTISGTGNIRNINLDKPQSELFKIYDPNTREYLLPKDDKIGGEKIWEFIMIPQKVGNLELPIVSFSYFNPDKKQYHTIKSSQLRLKVLPGKYTASITGDKSYFKVEDKDDKEEEKQKQKRLRLMRHNVTLSFQKANIYNSPLFWAYLSLLPFVVIVMVSFDYYKRVREKGREKRELFKWKLLLKELKGDFSQINDTRQFYTKALSIIENYIEYKLGSSIKGKTKKEIREELKKLGWASQLIEEFLQEWEAIEFARYSPASHVEELKLVYERLQNIITKVEKA